MSFIIMLVVAKTEFLKKVRYNGSSMLASCVYPTLLHSVGLTCWSNVGLLHRVELTYWTNMVAWCTKMLQGDGVICLSNVKSLHVSGLKMLFQRYPTLFLHGPLSFWFNNVA